MRNLFFALLFTLCTTVSAGPVKIRVHQFYNDRTTTSTISAIEPLKSWTGIKTFQATGTTSAGAGAATIIVYGSNANSTVVTDWAVLCTITLVLGTTSSGDACTTNADFAYNQVRVSAISGTDASVDVYVAGGANQ